MSDKTPVPPWDDCKVAFGVDDEELVWSYRNGKPRDLSLPKGWSLTETDCSGARCVAVFRVEGMPSSADGERVLAMLRRIGASAAV